MSFRCGDGVKPASGDERHAILRGYGGTYVIERHRHATVGRVRRHRTVNRAHGQHHVRMTRRSGGLRDLYSADTAEARV